MKTAFASLVLSVVAFVGFLCVDAYVGFRLEQSFTGHLKCAADANSIELAKRELRTAIDYLDSRHLTTGNTSILFAVPRNDLEFFYGNLSSALVDLENEPADASSLEKTNMLMKLRETLIDHGEKGDRVTRPDHLDWYPCHVPACLFLIGSFLWLVCSLCALAICGW